MYDERLLGACLIDCDAETNRSQRRRWREALVVALVFEAALVVWMLLLPLLTPGTPPREFVLMPRIPYSPNAVEHLRASPRPASSSSRELFSQIVFEPPRIPAQIERASEPPAGLAPPIIGTQGSGLADNGDSIPGGIGNGSTIIAPPRPAARPLRRVVHSENVQSALLIYSVLPEYPLIARNARISGTVELRAIIARDGTVRSVEILSGSPLLARAAVETVRQWRYRPTILDGQTVEVETRIMVRFVLQP